MKNVKRVRVNSAVYENIELVSATKAWKKEKGKFKLDTDNYEFIGAVDKNNPHIVQKAFVKGTDAENKTAYIDDFSALPKTAKKSVIDYLYSGLKNKKQKVYLVQGKKKKRNKKGR